MTTDPAPPRPATLQPATAADLPAVLALNNASEPAVNGLTAGALDELHGWADRFVVAYDGPELAGFILALPGPGLPYDSPNYRFFADRYGEHLYVDRLVVGPDHRRRGLGQELYRDVILHGRDRFPVVGAEVNVEPMNEPSLRLHVGLGFEALSEQDTEGGAKRVRLFARDLRPHVLFLCTGNAARSVMAKVMACDRSEAARFTGAGTHSIEGLPMSGRTRRALEHFGLADPSHRSHQLTSGDTASADLIVAFEPEHVDYVARHHPAALGRTIVLEEVEDPAGGEDDAFLAAAKQVDVVVDRLLDELPSLVSGTS